MALLSFIWDLSISMIAVSGIAFLVLLARRPVAQADRKHVAMARRHILRALTDQNIDHESLAAAIHVATQSGVFADLVLEVMALVDGPQRTVFLQRLRQAQILYRPRLRDHWPVPKQRMVDYMLQAAAGAAPFVSTVQRHPAQFSSASSAQERRARAATC